jgi:hypothetical protein
LDKIKQFILSAENLKYFHCYVVNMRIAFKNSLLIFGQMAGIVYTLFLYYLMIKAYQYGGIHYIDINHFQEGSFEIFFLMPSVLILISYSSFILLKQWMKGFYKKYRI